MKPGEVNKDGWVAPFPDELAIIDFRTASETSFVRVHSGNAPGAFMVRRSEVENIIHDPEALRDFLALDKAPTHIVDVKIPADFPMQTGAIGPQPNFGRIYSSGRQYYALEDVTEDMLFNSRPIR